MIPEGKEIETPDQFRTFRMQQKIRQRGEDLRPAVIFADEFQHRRDVSRPVENLPDFPVFPDGEQFPEHAAADDLTLEKMIAGRISDRIHGYSGSSMPMTFASSAKEGFSPSPKCPSTLPSGEMESVCHFIRERMR